MSRKVLPIYYLQYDNENIIDRMPLGETFVPRTSFKKLTKPKVKVAKGAVIDPVDKSELVRRGIVKFNDLQEVDVDCGMF